MGFEKDGLGGFPLARGARQPFHLQSTVLVSRLTCEHMHFSECVCAGMCSFKLRSGISDCCLSFNVKICIPCSGLGNP